jgi:hypothetical protein
MIPLPRKLQKLRGRSWDELRTRGAQALAAAAERRGWSEQVRVLDDAAFVRRLDPARWGSRDVSAESLLERLRTRTAPVFFAGFADREGTLAELRRGWPDAEAVVRARAERIAAGRFDLLGWRDLEFGDPIDWHREPIAGKQAPLRHWSRIDFLDPHLVGDKKIIWELNRHQYFLTLGQAYWYSGDEAHAATFAAHITGWMDQNPPKQGIQWASSLEVAFRAIAWLWALHFFKGSRHLTPALFARILKFLYVHARHLETYLSTYFSPNTHLTGEALGLFYLGLLLPEFRRSQRWLETGRQILLAQLDRQVRPDGVYFEQSSYYHRYTAEFYLHLLILAQENAADGPGPQVLDPGDAARVKSKLEALLEHLVWIARPDGTTPLFGDDDGGRLAPLEARSPGDFRATLATGAALLGLPELKQAAGEASAETVWLLGREGMRRFERLSAASPTAASRAFSDGGYYVMRDGWTRTANSMLIDCGPHGTLNCGHAHADALAFELAAHGRTLLVDPGTFTYTGSAELRDYFRFAAAHNTLTVDGQSSSVPDGPFAWRHIAVSSPHAWFSRGRFDYFAGSHDGYARLAPPVVHARSVLFLRGDYWIVRDQVQTSGAHRCTLHLHFALDTRPRPEEDEGCVALRERPEQSPGLEIFAFGSGGEWREECGWVSRGYGERVAAPVWEFVTAEQGDQAIVTLLFPRRAGAPRAHAREIPATGGRAFEIRDGETRDLVLLGSGRMAQCAPVMTDFEWTWLRFSPDDVVVELVLIGGRCCSVNGQSLADSAASLGWLSARRVGDAWHVETDGMGERQIPVAPGRATPAAAREESRR